jgi:hypothetical protein
MRAEIVGVAPREASEDMGERKSLEASVCIHEGRLRPRASVCIPAS